MFYIYFFWMLLWLANGIAGTRRSQPLSGVRLIKDGVSCVKKQTSRLYKGTVPLLMAWSCDITCLQGPFNVFVLLFLGAAGVLSLTHFQGFLASRLVEAWGHAFWGATVWRMKVVGSPQGLQFAVSPVSVFTPHAHGWCLLKLWHDQLHWKNISRNCRWGESHQNNCWWHGQSFHATGTKAAWYPHVHCRWPSKKTCARGHMPMQTSFWSSLTRLISHFNGQPHGILHMFLLGLLSWMI